MPFVGRVAHVLCLSSPFSRALFNPSVLLRSVTWIHIDLYWVSKNQNSYSGQSQHVQQSNEPITDEADAKYWESVSESIDSG